MKVFHVSQSILLYDMCITLMIAFDKILFVLSVIPRFLAFSPLTRCSIRAYALESLFLTCFDNFKSRDFGFLEGLKRRRILDN